MSGNRDPYHQDPNGFGFAIRNTPDFLFETGYLVDPPTLNGANSAGRRSYPGTYKFGAVYNRGQFADPSGRVTHGNYLIFGMASQAIFRSDAGSNRGLDATYGFDWSPGDVSRQNVQMTAGVRFNAPIASRKMDRIDCGFVYSKISDPFRYFGELLGGPLLGSEKAFEVNYSFQVKPYLFLEPTFQYYVDVGGNRALPNAPVFGLRTKITL
jgi:porin